MIMKMLNVRLTVKMDENEVWIKVYHDIIVNPPLSAFEEKDGNLSKVEINEMSRFMGNIRPKIPSDNTMPCWVVFFVEFLLDVRRYILFDIVFFECLKNYNM